MYSAGWRVPLTRYYALIDRLPVCGRGSMGHRKGRTGPPRAAVTRADRSRRAENCPAVSWSRVRHRRDGFLGRWDRGHRRGADRPFRRLSGRHRRRPAPGSAPSEPDGRDSPAADQSRSRAGRRRRPDPATNRIYRATRPPSARQSGRNPLTLPFRAGPLRAAQRRPALRIGGGQLQGACHRRSSDRDRQRRFARGRGDQEDGWHGDRSGPGIRGVFRHAGRGDQVRPCGFHSSPRRDPLSTHDTRRRGRGAVSDQTQKPDLERLLEYLRESRGFDFSGYKRTTLLRRVQKRMAQVGAKDYAAYLDHLQLHPEEFVALFNTILINVTSYFRDRPAWEYLQTEILPKIIASKQRYEPIRVWSAGVASGEEAFTVAMLLGEALGASEYRGRAKIYATDVDQDALAQARQGRAEEKDLEEVPANFREKYFEREGSHYVLRGDLRRSIIFGRHDLMQDAPISRIDLLVSRNTLMYFEAEAQTKILARLHYALTDNGYLFLGKAEMLLSRTALFTPVDLKQRVFTRVPQESLKDRLVVLAQAGSVDAANIMPRQARVRELVADALPIAQIVVDGSGFVIGINERARSAFALVTADVGRPLQDLETTNEELQATVEELETTNEELQSSNEELETMNEELESTNTELQTINTELQERSIQLNQVNTFMEQIMANLQLGVAVLDKDLRVQLWNRRGQDMWGVQAAETIGQPVPGLDIGLPLSDLAKPIKNCLNSGDGYQELTVEATNRRGKRFTCRVQCTAMGGPDGGRSVILLMEAVEEA